MSHISIVIAGPSLSDPEDAIREWARQALQGYANVVSCVLEVVRFPSDVAVEARMTQQREGGTQETVGRGVGITLHTALVQAFQELDHRLHARHQRSVTGRRPATL